jgi:hypothetical protein
MKRLTLTLGLILAGCGSQENQSPAGTYGGDTTGLIGEINSKIAALTMLTGNLNTLVMSDFSSCPQAGDTSDPLINKICQVAQASTVEVRTQLTDQLGLFVNQLQSEISANETDLANQQAAIDAANVAIAANSSAISTLQAQIAAANAQISAINATIVNIQGDVLTLQTQMTSANAAIAALQTLTNSINGTLNGTMISLSIGEELLTAGPYYEAALRRVDKTRFNGYVKSVGATQSLGSNPITAVNASSTITIALTSHGYSAGDIVELTALTSGRGLLTGDLQGSFVINSVPNANSFTVVAARAATSSGTLGGTIGTVFKVNAIGMATLWKSGDTSDAAVRVTNAGSKAYNFIIRRISTDASHNTAELCYDKTNASASFATINAAAAGGAGNILCK